MKLANIVMVLQIPYCWRDEMRWKWLTFYFVRFFFAKMVVTLTSSKLNTCSMVKIQLNVEYFGLNKMDFLCVSNICTIVFFLNKKDGEEGSEKSIGMGSTVQLTLSCLFIFISAMSRMWFGFYRLRQGWRGQAKGNCTFIYVISLYVYIYE